MSNCFIALTSFLIKYKQIQKLFAPIKNHITLSAVIFLHFNLEKKQDTYNGVMTVYNIETEESLIYSLESPEINIKTTNGLLS